MPAWLVGSLSFGFWLQPVLDCPTGEAYRRLRGLMSGVRPVLALLAVVLMAAAVLTVAVRVPLPELPTIPMPTAVQQLLP